SPLHRNASRPEIFRTHNSAQDPGSGADGAAWLPVSPRTPFAPFVCGRDATAMVSTRDQSGGQTHLSINLYGARRSILDCRLSDHHSGAAATSQRAIRAVCSTRTSGGIVMTTSTLGASLYAFFEDHLKRQKGLSSASIKSYRDGVRLFL